MGSLLQDLRYGFRTLVKNPGFTLVAVLTLAIGIGANTAIFSVVNAALLRPLGYPQADRLVHFSWAWSSGSESIPAVSPLEGQYWTERSHVFESSTIFNPGYGMNLSSTAEPEFIHGAAVSKTFFSVLGVHMGRGRDFLAEEDQPGNSRVVILTDALWRRRFAADPDIVGKQIKLNGELATVVGVLPPDFKFVEPNSPAMDVWFPLQLKINPNDNGHNYEVVARLKPGVTLQQAQAEMNSLLGPFRQDYPKHIGPKERGMFLVPYREWIGQYVRTPLLVLLGAVGLVLLIATANVTSLLLGRTAARQTETAVRLSLGASGFRLLRQFITEALLLAALGSAAALLVAPWVLSVLLALSPKDFFPAVGPVNLDMPVLGFTLAATLITGVIAGLTPGLRVSRLDLSGSLKEGSRTSTGALSRHRLRSILVVGEIALTIVLLAGAMLLIASLFHLWAVSPGFDSNHLWTFRMSLPPEKFKTTAQVWNFEQQMTDKLKTLPGVERVATTSNLPLEWGFNFGIDVVSGGEKKAIYIQGRGISPNYFQTMSIPMMRGRSFAETDTATSLPVVIVNETLARKCCNGRDPIGSVVYFGQTESNLPRGIGREIVGIVGDTRELGLDSPAPPTVFMPQSQMADDMTTYMDQAYKAAWVVKTQAPLALTDVQRLARDVDPAQPVVNLLPMSDVVSESVGQPRFMGVLMCVFAGLALVLAAIGLYGVISYSVTQRTHEIGVRMALGARPMDVLKMVMGQGLRHALLGVAVGLVASFAATRLLRSMLFGVQPTDPATFIAVSLVLTMVALAASYIPARRATKVDPIVALRYE